MRDQSEAENVKGIPRKIPDHNNTEVNFFQENSFMYDKISLQQSIELLCDYGQKGSFIIRKDFIENMHWLSFVRSDQQIIHWPRMEMTIMWMEMREHLNN